MNKTYLLASINNSPTVSIKAGADIDDVRFKAVKYDANGNAVLTSTAGEAFIGIALPTTGDAVGKVKKGDDLDIQIKDMGMAVAGGAFAVGSPLAANNAGQLVKATAGNFIIGYALEAATQAGDIIPVQVAKGYYPTGA